MTLPDGAARNVYSLRFTVGACAFDIRVNDGPVFERLGAEPGTVEVVVNRWVRNGPNTASVRLTPAPELGSFREQTRFEMSIFERDYDAPESAKRELARVESRGGHVPPLLTADFPAAVTFPEWSWTTTPEIPDGAETLDALVRELEDMHRLLGEGALDSAVARMRLRDEELATAQYETAEQTAARTRREFEFITAPGRGELQPLPVGGLTLRLFGERRLARVDRRNGTSPIYFRTPSRSFSMYVPLIFSRRDGRWTVVR